MLMSDADHMFPIYQVGWLLLTTARLSWVVQPITSCGLPTRYDQEITVSRAISCTKQLSLVHPPVERKKLVTATKIHREIASSLRGLGRNNKEIEGDRLQQQLY